MKLIEPSSKNNGISHYNSRLQWLIYLFWSLVLKVQKTFTPTTFQAFFLCRTHIKVNKKKQMIGASLPFLCYNCYS